MSLKDSCRFVRKSHCQGIILLCIDVRKDMELPVLFPMACTALDLKRDYCIIRHSLRCLRHLGVSFTGGTPFALSLNALRLPHAARSHSVSPYTTSHAKHYCSTRRAVLVCTIHHYCSPRRSVVVTPLPLKANETVASYGTRFVVCDIRACRLQEALPSSSVLTPCDYRMLQSQAKCQTQLVFFETVQRSQKGESGNVQSQ